MLSEHFYDFAIGNGVIQVVAQFGSKFVERGDFLFVCWVFYNGMNAVNVGLGDFGNIVCPIFPVVAVAAFFDNFGI